jgi:hypothetical protein
MLKTARIDQEMQEQGWSKQKEVQERSAWKEWVPASARSGK